MMETKIGLGLAAAGRPEYINIRQKPDGDKSEAAYRLRAYNLLDSAHEFGIRDFDAAASYGRGESFLLGWNADRRHKDIRISTKWGYTYVADWKIGYTGSHEIKEHSLEKLNEQWFFSRKFLPELKTYQIHSATLESGVLENQAVLERLHELKIQHKLSMGMSVSGSRQREVVEKAIELKVDGSELFDSFQLTYNIFERSTHSLVLQLIEEGKNVIVKEALANGRIFRNSLFPEYERAFTVLEELSREFEVGTDAIALRFVMDNLGPNLVLSGAATEEQLESNLDATRFRLDKNDLAKFEPLEVDRNSYWEQRSKLPWN